MSVDAVLRRFGIDGARWRRLGRGNVNDLQVAWRWKADNFGSRPDFNYQATKEAIARAVNGEPTPAHVVAQRNVAKHPFAPN